MTELGVVAQPMSARFRRRYRAGAGIGAVLSVASTVSVFVCANAMRQGGRADLARRIELLSGGYTLISLVVILILVFRILEPMAEMLERDEARLREHDARTKGERHRQRQAAEVHEAFEIADDEPAAMRVVARALGSLAPDLPAELLLADSSMAHLVRAAHNEHLAAPGCPVGSPHQCPAARRGQTTTFASSDAINACPHMAGRADGALSAVCVPVSSLGRAVGVLHITGPDGAPPSPDRTEALAQVATQAGMRLASLRSMATAELQASTDVLTGLLNRRAFNERLHQLLSSGQALSIAMIDIDHFKQVNDTYGHEVGDHALRLFADAVSSGLRDGDVFARWGGEEFVLVLPGARTREAEEIVERLRTRLGMALMSSAVPGFTLSVGVVDTDMSRVPDALMRMADDALLVAKSTGRDRIALWPDVENLAMR